MSCLLLHLHGIGRKLHYFSVRISMNEQCDKYEKIYKIISILLCIGVIINNCIIVSASNNSNDDIVTLLDAVYSRNKTVQGKYCTISIGTPSKTTAFQ